MINVSPIITRRQGLCYKLELSKFAIPTMHTEKYDNIFALSMRSLVKEGKDKLTKFHLMFAANNTWQGIIGGLEIWPYNQIPPMISGNINAGITNIISVNLDEHI